MAAHPHNDSLPQPGPRHVAIIMDGNGRWAKLRHKQRVEGHRAGIESVRDVVETSARLGLEVLTLYAFSVENSKRPETEVAVLMGLLQHYLRAELATLLKNNIRFQVIGHTGHLPGEVQEELQRGTERTRPCTGRQFNIALDYSGRAEITDAVRRLVGDVLTNNLDPYRVDEDKLASYLYVACKARQVVFVYRVGHRLALAGAQGVLTADRPL